MGLMVRIYKNGPDCSNGGVSAYMDEGVLVNVDGPFEPDNVRTAALLLVPGNVARAAKVVPAVLAESGEWVPANSLPAADGAHRPLGPMMGGCYVGAADARFCEAVEALTGARFNGAVPLHDRFETPQQYAALSAD